MTERLEIVCFGNAIMDVMAPVEEGFLASHAIQKGGMNLIDEARALMLTEALDSPQMIAGGSGCQQRGGAGRSWQPGRLCRAGAR